MISHVFHQMCRSQICSNCSNKYGLQIVALSLHGLGWNFGLISGTAQIVDSTEPSTSAKTQEELMF